MSRRLNPLVSLTLAILFLMTLVLPAAAQPFPPSGALTGPEREQLHTYAEATWQSFVAMVYPDTGLPADSVTADHVPNRYTSPTNIGAYIWSTLAARDLQIIDPSEARSRIGKTLDTLSQIERHTPSGMFYNWYDPATGAKLTVWPDNGSHVYPFLSSVDNGWLATALIMVANSVPQLRDEAESLVSSMNFKCYLNPGDNLLKGGFWLPSDQPGGTVLGDFCDMGTQVAYTGFDFGTLNTEPRISSYIGIAKGQLPPTHYFAMWRTFPNTCDWGWPEMAPVGVTRTYLGVNVFEGHYTYAGMDFVPSWGGSMFEALMPDLFVPEEQWGAQSWGINHPIYVQGQIYHGLEDAKYGYWGFSPSSNTVGNGYDAFGVDAMGMNPDGYPSDLQYTFVDYGFKDPSGIGYCPGRDPKPLPTSYGDGIVTPHASFLALRFDPQAAFANLDKMQSHFAVYDWGGFYDAVDVRNGNVARRYLALDQGMIMAALGNALRNDDMRRYFTQGDVQQAVQPILAMEQFTSGVAQPAQQAPALAPAIP
jgi:hypothetical protein